MPITFKAKETFAHYTGSNELAPIMQELANNFESDVRKTKWFFQITFTADIQISFNIFVWKIYSILLAIAEPRNLAGVDVTNDNVKKLLSALQEEHGKISALQNTNPFLLEYNPANLKDNLKTSLGRHLSKAVAHFLKQNPTLPKIWQPTVQFEFNTPLSNAIFLAYADWVRENKTSFNEAIPKAFEKKLSNESLSQQRLPQKKKSRANLFLGIFGVAGIVGGIVMIVVGVIFPPLLPILAPIGGVLLLSGLIASARARYVAARERKSPPPTESGTLSHTYMIETLGAKPAPEIALSPFEEIARIIEKGKIALLCKKTIEESTWETDLLRIRKLVENDSQLKEEINTKNYFGGTLLHRAAFKSNLRIVELLVTLKFDKNRLDNYENTPLHLAVEWSFGCFEKDALEMIPLLKTNENINKPNIYGWTPLHFAAQYASLATVKVLIENGADPKLLTNDNKSIKDILNKRIADVQTNNTPEWNAEEHKDFLDYVEKLLPSSSPSTSNKPSPLSIPNGPKK